MKTAGVRLQHFSDRLDAALVKVASDRWMRFVDNADAMRCLRARITVGDLTLIPMQYVVRGMGPAKTLGPVEFGVLNQLMSEPGKVLSYERIINEVWGSRGAMVGSLTRAVCRLRAKIGDGDPGIDSVHGVGFVLRSPGAFLDPDQDGAIRFADLVLNPSTQSAKRGGRSLTLTPAEFAMLQRFIGTPGKVFTATELADAAARPGCEPPTGSVPVHLSRLRSELASPGESQLVHNVRGVGYVLEQR